jgi:serine/threonine-protein kinase
MQRRIDRSGVLVSRLAVNGEKPSNASTGGDRLLGETVGNYRVISKIGQGGMGAVYLCVHTVLGRQAALKVLLPEYSNNSELVGRFFNEARATAQLRHHAFVRVFDSGTRPDGSAYLVMEYLQGENLGSCIDRRGVLSLSDCLAVTRDVAEGVGFAHRHGIIHRDLKPDNIFLSTDSEEEAAASGRMVIKVLDFGIAKLMASDREGSARTRTGLLLGTPLYMSPEQCRGAGAVDFRSDVYSLGCIVHSMLTGNPPFPFQGFGEIISAHMGTPPPPLRALAPPTPEPIERLVLRMLAKDPDHRPGMEIVIAELDRIRTLLPEARGALTLVAPAAGAAPAGGAAAWAQVSTPAGLATPRPGSPVLTPASIGRTRLLPTPDPTTLRGTASEITDDTSRVLRRRRGGPMAAIGAAIAVAAAIAVLVMRSQGGGASSTTHTAAPAAPAAPEPNPRTTARGEAADQPSGRAPEAPAGPATSSIKLVGVPAGATVRLDGRAVTPPLVIPRRSETHRLTIEAEGFEPRELSIDGATDQTVAIELLKSASPPAPASTPKRKRRHDSPGFNGFTDL